MRHAGLSFQDGEPDLHLVEPRSSRRREVKVHIRMTIQPAIVLGLVRVEVVEDHMDCGVRVVSDDMVHEIEEFGTPSAILWAAVTLPVATSKAANNVEVPLRL